MEKSRGNITIPLYRVSTWTLRRKERSAFSNPLPENIFRFGALRFQLVFAHLIVNAPRRNPEQPCGLRLISPHALHGRL